MRASPCPDLCRGREFVSTPRNWVLRIVKDYMDWKPTQLDKIQDGIPHRHILNKGISFEILPNPPFNTKFTNYIPTPFTVRNTNSSLPTSNSRKPSTSITNQHNPHHGPHDGNIHTLLTANSFNHATTFHES
jgi:hypothetical protein